MTNRAGGPRKDYVEPVVQAVEELRQELVTTSLDIHAHPELNYQEYHAAALLADSLERHGFQVERGVGGVETASRTYPQKRQVLYSPYQSCSGIIEPRQRGQTRGKAILVMTKSSFVRSKTCAEPFGCLRG